MSQAGHNSLVVRAAAPEDAAPLATLARQLLDYERGLNEYAGELTSWAATPDEMRRQIRQPNLRFFVAEVGGEMVGYLKATVYGRPVKRREAGNTRWLRDVFERGARQTVDFLLRRPRPNVRLTGGYVAGAFVRPDLRRASVGRALLAVAEDWFRSQGLQTSELHVLYANESARQFWEEAGYQPLVLGMRKRL